MDNVILRKRLEKALTPIELERFFNNSDVSLLALSENLSQALQSAFNWSSSPEGRDYWDEIHLRIVTST